MYFNFFVLSVFRIGRLLDIWRDVVCDDNDLVF